MRRRTALRGVEKGEDVLTFASYVDWQAYISYQASGRHIGRAD